jgi:hypothetical protein
VRITAQRARRRPDADTRFARDILNGYHPIIQ